MAHVQSVKYILFLIILSGITTYLIQLYILIHQFSVTKAKEKQVHHLQYGEYLRERKKHHKFSIRDHVLISQYCGTFRKSYHDKNITKEIFEVWTSYIPDPPMYHLRDLKGELIEGSFYEQELQWVSKK